MKIAFSLFIAFFICNSHGLKCYDYKVNSPGRITSSELAVDDCNSYPGDYGSYGGYGGYLVYCGTITFKNGEIKNKDCGDAEFCTERGCIDSSHCKHIGTFEHNYPNTNFKVTMTCCEEDLCNIESSAQTFNYTNSVFCIIISLFLFVLS